MAKVPYTPTPLNPDAYPPKGSEKTHKVKDGDNWWSLQKLYARANVWDLIQFNFGTQDPNEVNWYLKNKVGCKKVTPDGKNYCFSTLASPGVIYIPPPEWAPGKPGSGTDSIPPDNTSPLSENDLHARALVLDTLMGSDFPNFRFYLPSGYEVSRDRIRRVIGPIAADKIKVRLGGEANGPAKYFPKNAGGNVLNIPYSLVFDPEGKALVVHECVHAMMDLDVAQTSQMIDMHSEAAAYIAQMLYLRNHKDMTQFRKGFPVRKLQPGEKRSRAEWDDNRVFKMAWEVANELTTRKLDAPTGTWRDHQVSYMLYAFLLMTLAEHGQYKHYVHDETGYDGVS